MEVQAGAFRLRVLQKLVMEELVVPVVLEEPEEKVEMERME